MQLQGQGSGLELSDVIFHFLPIVDIFQQV